MLHQQHHIQSQNNINHEKQQKLMSTTELIIQQLKKQEELLQQNPLDQTILQQINQQHQNIHAFLRGTAQSIRDHFQQLKLPHLKTCNINKQQLFLEQQTHLENRCLRLYRVQDDDHNNYRANQQDRPAALQYLPNHTGQFYTNSPEASNKKIAKTSNNICDES